jgi:hypothetical protein
MFEGKTSIKHISYTKIEVRRKTREASVYSDGPCHVHRCPRKLQTILFSAMFRPSLHVISIIDSIKTRRSAAQKDFIETDLGL